MKLEDLKKTERKDTQAADQIDGLSNMIARVNQFNKKRRRQDFIETIVAIIAFCVVVYALFKAPSIYPKVAEKIFPTAKDLKMHFLMYSSLALMAVYALLIPIKLHRSKVSNDSYSWTIASRVDSEIDQMEKQNKLWSSAHLWSFAPAVIIGLMFFWGLHISIIGTWVPNVYLILYLVFMGLSVFAGMVYKSHMVSKNTQPLLRKLCVLKSELDGFENGQSSS